MDKKKINILIIETEPIIIEIIRELFAFTINKDYEGYTTKITCFDNLKDGEQFIQKNKLDLAIIAHPLIYGEGHKFAIQMKRKYPNTYVVLTSGYTEDIFRLHSNFYYDSYLEKPFTAQSLRNILKEVI